MDPTLEKKCQAMLDLLANCHQSRAKPSIAAETDSSSATIASFLSKFSDSKRSIEAQISTLSSSEPDPDRIKHEAFSITTSISSLEQLLAESSYLLSFYEIRSSPNSLAELNQTLEAINLKLLPKKKFSFRTKSSKLAAELRLPEEELEQAVIPVWDSFGFKDRVREVLRKSFRVYVVAVFGSILNEEVEEHRREEEEEEGAEGGEEGGEKGKRKNFFLFFSERGIIVISDASSPKICSSSGKKGEIV